MERHPISSFAPMSESESSSLEEMMKCSSIGNINFWKQPGSFQGSNHMRFLHISWSFSALMYDESIMNVVGPNRLLAEKQWLAVVDRLKKQRGV